MAFAKEHLSVKGIDGSRNQFAFQEFTRAVQYQNHSSRSHWPIESSGTGGLYALGCGLLIHWLTQKLMLGSTLTKFRKVLNLLSAKDSCFSQATLMALDDIARLHPHDDGSTGEITTPTTPLDNNVVSVQEDAVENVNDKVGDAFATADTTSSSFESAASQREEQTFEVAGEGFGIRTKQPVGREGQDGSSTVGVSTDALESVKGVARIASKPDSTKITDADTQLHSTFVMLEHLVQEAEANPHFPLDQVKRLMDEFEVLRCNHRVASLEHYRADLVPTKEHSWSQRIT